MLPSRRSFWTCPSSCRVNSSFVTFAYPEVSEAYKDKEEERLEELKDANKTERKGLCGTVGGIIRSGEGFLGGFAVEMEFIRVRFLL